MGCICPAGSVLIQISYWSARDSLKFYLCTMDHSVYIKALDLDREGDWDGAHALIQDLDTPEAAWIHAYLHRKEGDDWNARYWYNRADKPFFDGSLEREWEELYKMMP